MTERPYGSWPSPITAELIVARSRSSIGEAAVGLVDVWWAEARPEEGGRVADRAPPPRRRARRRAARGLLGPHPGARVRRWRLVAAPGRPRVLRQLGRPAPVAPRRRRRPARSALTPEPGHDHGDRYADGALHRRRPLGDLRARAPPRRATVSRPTRSWPCGRGPVATSTSPSCWSAAPTSWPRPGSAPTAAHLAWFQWHHPDMPWDGTELHVAELHSDPDGERSISIGPSVVVAGGRDEVGHPARVDRRRRPALPLRPHRLVEPLPPRRRLRSRRPSPPAGGAGARGRRRSPPSRPRSACPTGCSTSRRYAVLGDGRDPRGLRQRRPRPPRRRARPAAERWCRCARRSPPSRRCGPSATAPCSSAASPTTEAVVARRSTCPRRRPDGPSRSTIGVVRPARDLGIDPAWFSVPEPIRVRHHRRPLRPRPLLPADQPRRTPARPASRRR